MPTLMDPLNRPRPENPESDGHPGPAVETPPPDRRPAAALLTLDEVATLLHMSKKSVQRRIKSGVIRKAPIGGRLVRISLDELRRLTAESLFQNESEDPDALK